MSNENKFRQQLKNYYEKQFCDDLHYYDRSQLMGQILLLVRLFWYIQQMLTKSVEQKLIEIDHNFKNIDSLNIISLLMEHNNSNPVYIAIGLNILFIILILFSFISYSYGHSFTWLKTTISYLAQIYNYLIYIPFIDISTHQLFNNPIASTNLAITIIISIIIRLHDQDYSYNGKDNLGKKNAFVWDFVLLYLEALLVILKEQVEDGILNCIFSIFLSGYTIIDSIFNQCYNKRNIRFYYSFFCHLHTLIVLDILFSIVINSSYPLVISLLILLPISYKISSIGFNSMNDLDYIYKNLLIHANKITFKRIQTLDFFLRNLYDHVGISYEDFIMSKNSVIFEKLISDHQINCDDSICQFCHDNNTTKEKFEQNILEGKQRKNFLKGFIRGQYMQIIQSQFLKRNSIGKTQLFFSYFHYLIEVEKSKVLGYVEMIRWKQQLKLTLRESALFNNIFMQAKNTFEQNTSTNQNNSINNTSLYNESIEYEGSISKSENSLNQNQSNIESMNFFIGILYDEELNRVEKNYFQCLAQKLKVLDILSGDHIDLVEFKRSAILLKQQIDQLRKDLIYVGNIHFNSHKVQYYMEGFTLHLGFGEKKRRIFKKKSNRRNNNGGVGGRNKFNPKMQSIENSIFEKDNCVLFMSLITNNIGIVKRAQNKFENIFGIQTKDIIGKSINSIMPPVIAKHHDKMMSMYIQNSSSSYDQTFTNNYDQGSSKQMYSNQGLSLQQIDAFSSQSRQTPRRNQTNDKQSSNNNNKSSDKNNNNNNNNNYNNQQIEQQKIRRIIEANNYFRLLLARHHDGWAIPISLQFKVDCIGQTDCGITAHIKSIQNDFYYFLTSSKYFQTQLITQNAYDRLFSKFLNKNDIQSIHLNRVIPLLNYFEKLWKQGNDQSDEVHKDLVKTVAFLPKQQIFNQQQQQQSQNLLYTKRSQNNNNAQPLFQKLESHNLSRELQKYSVEQYDMFSIKMKFYHYKNAFVSYNIIEIQQIRRIVSPQSQKENLSLLKTQLKALLDINFDISRDIELLQKVEQLALFDPNNSQENFQVNFSMQIDDNSSQNSAEKIYQQGYQEIFNRNESQENNNQIIQRNQLDYNLINLQKVNMDSLNPLNVKNYNNNNNNININNNNLFAKIPNEGQSFQDNYSIQNQPNGYRNSMIQSVTGRNNEEENSPYHKNISVQSNEKNSIQKQISDQANEYNSYLQSLQFQKVDENASTQLYSFLQATDRQNIQSTLADAMRDNPTSRRSHILAGQQEDQEDYQEIISRQKQDSERQILEQPFQQQQKGLYDLLKGNKKKTTKNNNNINSNLSNNININNNNMNQPQSMIGIELGSYAQMSLLNSQTQINTKVKSNNNQQSMNQIDDLSNNQIQSSQKQNNNKQLQFQNTHQQTQPFSSKQQEKQKLKKIQLEEEDLNQYNRKNNNKDGYSSDFMSNSAQRDEDRIRKEQEERSRILDASSVKTSQSHNHEHKKNIQRLIKSERKDISIILLNIFGYLAILTLAILTLTEFFKIQTKLIQSKEDILLIPWANTFRVSFSNPIAYNSLADLIEFNGFKDNSIYSEKLVKDVRDRVMINQNEIKRLFSLYLNSDISTKPYFQYINTNIMAYVYNIDDKVTPNQDVLKFVQAYKVSKNMTTQYLLHNMMVYNYFYSSQQTSIFEEPYYQKQQIDNFIPFSTNLTYVQTQIQLESKSILHQVESEQQDLMSLILIVAFMLIAALFPLYYFVQYKNQILLRLFATIPSISLSCMVRSIQLAIDFSNDGNKMSKSKFILFSRADNSLKKRKNISSTSSLPKFKLSLCFICFIAFVLIIIQPIVNYILVSQFNAEVQDNIDLLGSLYNLRAQIGSNLAVNYKYLVFKLVPQKNVYNPGYFAARLKAFSTSNNVAFQNVTLVINESQNQPKKQQKIYNEFFYEIVNGNICNAISKFPQYVADENKIDMNNCSVIQSGILQKGFQISAKRFFEVFADVYSILQMTDQQKQYDQLIFWQQQVKLKDFDEFSENLIKVLIIIKDFLIETMKTDLDDIIRVQIILLTFQIVLLIVFFSIGWHLFLKFVYNEMILIKQLLSIIQIDFIIDNPYIISYLTK